MHASTARGAALAIGMAALLGDGFNPHARGAYAQVKIDLYEARGEPTDALRAAAAGDVDQAVIEFLDAWARHDFVDPEILWLAGIAVGKSDKPGVDAKIADWIHKSPTPRRREVAAAFLDGYWGFVGRVDSGAVADLRLALRRSTAADPDYPTALRALLSLLNAKPANLAAIELASVRQQLLNQLEALERSGEHAGLVAALRAIRR